MYQNKFSPESYIEALKLDPKLKLIAHSKVARKNNPTLEKFFTYATKTSSKIRLNSGNNNLSYFVQF
ncbi:hypothetical protein GN958_ATG10461 [Phytophthora infestans]|uniref:Uncharacterized protein n=1 Tax=Phytophthora infestans TaxID=4787 RepID=A0A8S9ULD9_PHYIN|nr:hypothetical protein GN958_ATG10461 [Phytophthora infestans]